LTFHFPRQLVLILSNTHQITTIIIMKLIVFGLLVVPSCAFFVPQHACRSQRSAFVVSRPSSAFVAAEVEGAAEAAENSMEFPDVTDEQPSVVAETAPAEQPERHTAFVGNLPFDITEPEVRDMFGAYGTVENINIPKNKATDLPRGFAFVDMSSAEEVSTAISSLDGTEFRERALKVTLSVPKDQLEKKPRPERRTQQRPQAPEGCKKIYVGNIPFEFATEDIVQQFQEFGEVVDFFMPTDRESGIGRGFCFITMKEENAEQAIAAMNGQEFQGRRLVVNEPLPPGESRPPRNTGGGRGGAPRDNRMKLYVGNLSFYTGAGTIRELFEEFGEVYDCYLPEDSSGNGGSRGFGFVTMSKEAAQQAIDELDGCEIDGRLIRVNAAEAKRSSRGRD